MIYIRGKDENFLKSAIDLELDEFARWAFGEKYHSYNDQEEFLDAWNRRHGENLYLCADSNISSEVEKMTEEWIKRRLFI